MGSLNFRTVMTARMSRDNNMAHVVRPDSFILPVFILYRTYFFNGREVRSYLNVVPTHIVRDFGRSQSQQSAGVCGEWGKERKSGSLQCSSGELLFQQRPWPRPVLVDGGRKQIRLGLFGLGMSSRIRFTQLLVHFGLRNDPFAFAKL